MLGEYHGQEKGEINFGNNTGNKVNYILDKFNPVRDIQI